jgi:hypothetical protein
MKVKFIKHPIALNIVNEVGDVVDLDDKKAMFLIENGYCEEMKTAPAKKKVTKKK